MTTEHWTLLGLTALAIAIWYYLARRPSLASNPLHIFALTFRRLWRNRSLVMILLGLWLASWALNVLAIEPLIMAPHRERMGFARQKPDDVFVGTRALTPGEVGHWTADSLPKVRQLGIGGHAGTSGWPRLRRFRSASCRAGLHLWVPEKRDRCCGRFGSAASFVRAI